jgi:hypothetical protein
MAADTVGANAGAVARRILSGFPPDRLHRTGVQPHLLVLGASPLARELCLGLLRLCHFRHALRPALTVAAAPGAIDDLEAFLPGAALVGDVVATGLPEGDFGPLGTLLRGRPPLCGIYACMAVALPRLRAILDGFPPPLTSTEPLADGHDFPCFNVADVGAATGGVGSDAVARAIHELYLQEQIARGQELGAWPTLVPWDEMTDADRDGNRFLADHAGIKLRDIGCTPTRAAAGGSLQFTPEELEQLARTEHERWSAVRLLAGYRYGPVRDDKLKLHPDLVPFDELSRPKQDLDRIAVRATDAYLARAGIGVMRDAPVALLAAEDAGLAPGFERHVGLLLAELARHYPDRRIVLRSDFACTATRAFCHFAMEAGEVPLNAVMLEAPPPPDARQLLRRAARIEVVPRETQRETALRRGTRLSIRLGRPTGEGREVALDGEGRVLSRPWQR